MNRRPENNVSSRIEAIRELACSLGKDFGRFLPPVYREVKRGSRIKPLGPKFHAISLTETETARLKQRRIERATILQRNIAVGKPLKLKTGK